MSPENTSKRQERRAQLEREKRQQQTQRLIVIGLIVLGTSLLVFAIVGPQLQPQDEPTTTAPSAAAVNDIVTAVPVERPNANGLSVGDPKATVTIDVFEDFQCPACQYFTQAIEPLVIENLVATGKARYVYHNYPFLDGNGASNGGESDQAANASMCANEQGKFWEMHDIIYANWDGENQGAFSAPRLQAMAQSVGLEMEAFNECLAANKYEADVQADFELGQEMGVNGTPTVFVNGKQAGEPGKIATYEDIAQAVEQALTE